MLLYVDDLCRLNNTMNVSQVFKFSLNFYVYLYKSELMLTTRQDVKWVNHTHENSQALIF